MTKIFPSAFPSIISQADNVNREHLKKEHKVPTSLHNGKWPRSDLLPQGLTEITSPFPLKTVIAQRTLQWWFWDMSPPSPQVASLLNKNKPSIPTSTCLSNTASPYMLCLGTQSSLTLSAHGP